MKKFMKLLASSTLLLSIVLSLAVPVFAAQTDLSAYLSGTHYDDEYVILDPTCYLYGYVSCDTGTWMGNSCYWLARQGGSEPFAGTNTAASFGQGDSYTNIMSKSYMVTTYPTTLHEYEKTAAIFTYYTQANTRLYH